MTVLADHPRRADRRVRVWFGEHVIADYTADPAKALRYQAGMTRRFVSLRITVEPAAPLESLDAENR
jgi:hypothetical protein